MQWGIGVPKREARYLGPVLHGKPAVFPVAEASIKEAGQAWASFGKFWRAGVALPRPVVDNSPSIFAISEV